MKKILLIICSLLIITSCSNHTEKKIPVVEWTDNIVSKYPNCHSNELTKKIVQDSICKYANGFIGKKPTILDGVEFIYRKMREKNADSCVVFFGSSCESSWIETKDDERIISTEIIMGALGKVDKATASKLDKGKKYYITGILHAWDDIDRFFLNDHLYTEYLDFGVFILNDIKITEVKKDND